MGDERRTLGRLQAYLPVRLQRLQTPRVMQTLTKDLSSGGLRCVSQIPAPVASEFKIELTLAGHEPFQAKGRTAWFSILPHSEQFDIGIVFTEVSQENQRRLSTYLDYLSRQAVSSRFA